MPTQKGGGRNSTNVLKKTAGTRAPLTGVVAPLVDVAVRGTDGLLVGFRQSQSHLNDLTVEILDFSNDRFYIARVLCDLVSKKVIALFVHT